MPPLTCLLLVHFNPNGSVLQLVIGAIVFLVLLTISALVSGSESAYFSLTPAQWNKLERSKSKNSKLVIQLLRKPEQLLGTILIANNTVNVGLVVLSSYLSAHWLVFTSTTAAIIFEVVLITLLLLLFGEIMPKIFSTQHPLRFAKAIAFPLYALHQFLKPISYLLVSSTQIVHKRIGKKKEKLSLEDLSNALDVTQDQNPEDQKILKGIVSFGNRDVAEIMTPRLDIDAIELNTPFNEILEQVVNWGYSRIPIYEENLDHIKGVLYSKDLLPHLEALPDFNWTSLIRPAYFVPEYKKINDLLEDFQSKNIHLAIVVDEYGGTCGLISMDDILEEIVGEISDESDFDEKLFIKQSDGSYIFEGKIILNNLCKITHVPEDYFNEVRGEAETLAGLLLEIKGNFPIQGESIVYKHFTFQIAGFEGRRIQKVRVIIENPISPL